MRATGLLLAAALGCAPRPAAEAGTDSAGRAAPPPAGPAAWLVTPEGYGPVTIGASIADLNAALGERLAPAYDMNEQCDYVRPAALPPGVVVMVEHDTVVRVDVDSAGILTPEGAGVGDPEERVLSLYGSRAVVTAHKYTGPVGHDVTVVSRSDSTRLTIFETDGQRVVRYRAGVGPAVRYVEGCA